MISATDDTIDPAARPSATPDSNTTAVTNSRSTAIGIIIMVAIAYIGASMGFTTPLSISLALRLERIAPDAMVDQLSNMVIFGTLAAIIVLVIVGRLSDATRSRWGMRRPWLIGSIVLDIAGAVFMANAPSLTLLWIGFVLTCIGAGTGLGVLYAITADQVPHDLQGMASGVLGAVTVLGNVLGLFIVQLSPHNALLIFGGPAILAGVPGIALTLFITDRRRAEPSNFSLRMILECFVVDGRNYPSFAWFIPAVILAFSTVGIAQSYSYFLVGKFVGDDTDAVARTVFVLLMIFNATAFLVSLITGRLADRYGIAKQLFRSAAILFIVGGAILFAARSMPVLYVGYITLGTAMGIGISSYLAVALKAIRGTKNPGRDLNIAAAASTLSFSFVAFFAPYVLDDDGGNVSALLLVGMTLTAASLLFMPKVKV